MKKLLAIFSYAGNFYELYVDKYGKLPTIYVPDEEVDYDDD